MSRLHDDGTIAQAMRVALFTQELCPAIPQQQPYSSTNASPSAAILFGHNQHVLTHAYNHLLGYSHIIHAYFLTTSRREHVAHHQLHSRAFVDIRSRRSADRSHCSKCGTILCCATYECTTCCICATRSHNENSVRDCGQMTSK